jgi:dephospho-CoA kinase
VVRPSVRRIGLTGGIASGKSYVRARFEALGVATIDADVLARDAVVPGSPVLQRIVERFGTGILDASGALDRRAMATLAFGDQESRRALEGIIHPSVRQALDGWFQALPPSRPFGIADVPLLYETGLQQDYDRIVVTACEPEMQLRRLMARDGLTEAEAMQRMAAQWPLAEKVRRADYVIRTDGTLDQTAEQVGVVYWSLTGIVRDTGG